MGIIFNDGETCSLVFCFMCSGIGDGRKYKNLFLFYEYCITYVRLFMTEYQLYSFDLGLVMLKKQNSK